MGTWTYHTFVSFASSFYFCQSGPHPTIFLWSPESTSLFPITYFLNFATSTIYILDFSYNRNDVIFKLLSDLLHLTYDLKVPAFSYKHLKCISFLTCWIVFHCIDILHFLHSFICFRPLCLFQDLLLRVVQLKASTEYFLFPPVRINLFLSP